MNSATRPGRSPRALKAAAAQSLRPAKTAKSLNAAKASAKPAVRTPPRQRLDESLGFLIAEAERASKRVLFARIAEHGIRRGGWFVLRALWEIEGMTQRELAQRLGLMETSVLEMVRALEGDGLVSRSRDAEDKRKIRIHLTAQGRAIEPQLMQVAQTVNEQMVQDLSPAEAVLLKLLLKKVRASLMADADPERGALA